ncbi:MAG: 1,4-alpha-glucan branching enzyme, partial [Verrucomicrobia bacterium]|nr:1,4-alpha-glucan branching enzyme [Verrucomicrobiota bacterium]
MNPTLSAHDLDLLLHAEHPDPFAVLGLQSVEGNLVIRAFRPDVKALSVVDRMDPKSRFAGEQISNAGIFEARLNGRKERFDYVLEVTNWAGETVQVADPYSFGPLLGELDMHLFCEGNHYEIYRKLGAQLTEVNGHRGVLFSVWAPNAQRVSVVGDFNAWDGRLHPMRKRVESGIWEIFIPGVGEQAHYKFELRNCFGQTVLKSDPFGFFGQHGLQTASLVFNLDRYKWADQEWMERRPTRQWYKEPISIYEVHLGSWARVPQENDRYLSYREFGDRLLSYVKDMGYTHIELMPVAEHPFDG